MPSTADHARVRTLVASIPGGPAPQYRVQFKPKSESHWRMFASFKQREAAEGCARDLAAAGIQARIVANRICPTSA